MGNQSKCDEIDECLEELGTFVCDNLCCHRQEDLFRRGGEALQSFWEVLETLHLPSPV